MDIHQIKIIDGELFVYLKEEVKYVNISFKVSNDGITFKDDNSQDIN